ncbi:HalOD1 output domain-containing protein [Natrialbaceae archaeon AArc-T1-2]|uniref:HalOD1 output domain-containing protein n=1 Tax=Natrialbaceae archaeon AArc-T1-2 TaxID=3053904 RepID=UPI00255B18B0|nr:HalOD1 output domain-containing protein [Natrialbaceae archaeon AArc-T1-2]WIV67813.1 hypothetical protein QQ977_03520 [Natrialbaceae archaeon AArc-T1-2]
MSKQLPRRPDDGNGRNCNEIRYDRDEDEPPSVAIATALARYHDEDVTAASTRLYDHVDPEALDALFANRYDGSRRRGGTVRFAVDDVTVVVRPERVRVYSDSGF